MGILASTLITMIVTTLAGELMRNLNSGDTAKYRKVATELANKITADNDTYQRFVNASAERRASLLNAMVQTLGYGPQINKIREEIMKRKDIEKHHADTHAKRQDELNKAYQNTVDNQNLHDSTTITAPFLAASWEQNDGKTASGIANEANPTYEQNINGGLTDAKKVQ